MGERLDAHRKARHFDLTMTGMYNVLEKLRAGGALTAKEKGIHDAGLVSILQEIHDELDAAVAEAYGWPRDLADEAILERLVALNAERAAEERRGQIRWLRPEYQNPDGAAQTQTEADVGVSAPDAGDRVPPGAKRAWPKEMAAQAQAVREALAALQSPATADAIARSFTRARTDRVEDLLDTLAALGQCRQTRDGHFVAQ